MKPTRSLKAGLFEALVDRAGEVAAGGVGLDDRERALRGHGMSS
jgi:hypothetical protein